MKTIEEATKLAKLMVDIGNGAGKKVTAILTSMEEPLGEMIGNGNEVYEAIETLKGNGPKDVVLITATIGAQLLVDAKIESDFDIAKEKLITSLNNGVALEKFREMVIAQGGDVSYVDEPEKLFTNEKIIIVAKESGYINKINALNIGVAASRLGAGRETKDDIIDLKVGLKLHKKIGDKVEAGQPLVTMYVADKGIDEATKLIEESIVIGNEQLKVELIKKIIK